MNAAYDYIRDGAEIYKNSFAIIRREADLGASRARRSVWLCASSMPAAWWKSRRTCFFRRARRRRGIAALAAGAPILCDANMVAHGITRARLPANNEVICTLADPRVAELAKEMDTTRTAAAMEFWRPHLAGAVVAFGNAPTALFHLLEMLDAGAPRPALILAMPVGFVGASESKEAAIADGRIPVIAMRGRKGGSAMAAAAINALGSEKE